MLLFSFLNVDRLEYLLFLLSLQREGTTDMSSLNVVFIDFLLLWTLKQKETQSACAESTDKGVNQRLKCITQGQQQRPESPTVTLDYC